MDSIVVHYKELALKGRNRPWFIQILVAQSQDGARRAERAVGPLRHGADRDRSRRRSGRGGGARAAAARLRRRQLLVRRTRAARSGRRSRPRSSHDLGDRQVESFRVSARARRQALSAHVAADRARGGRAHQAGEGLARGSRAAGADGSHRDAARPVVLFLRQGAGRRRAADRHERPGGVPAVGRHRFAGGRVPDDAPRLLGAASSTSTATRFSRAPRRRRCARSRRS